MISAKSGGGHIWKVKTAPPYDCIISSRSSKWHWGIMRSDAGDVVLPKIEMLSKMVSSDAPVGNLGRAFSVANGLNLRYKA